MQKAHQVSVMIDWGKIHTLEGNVPIIYVFPVDSIHSPLSAVPFNTEESIITAIEWMYLRPKIDWYKLFTTKMDEVVKNN